MPRVFQDRFANVNVRQVSPIQLYFEVTIGIVKLGDELGPFPIDQKVL